MLILLAFASISQLASYFLTRNSEIWVFYNLYTVIDSIIWAYIFFRNSKRVAIKGAISGIVLLQVITAIYLFISVGIDTKFFNEFVCLNSLLQILWVLSFFYERYTSEEIEALEKEPMFWYCVGILIYAPTTYFHFAYYYIIQAEEETSGMRTIHHLLNAGMYFIFSFGILINVLRTSKFRNAFIRHTP